MRGDLDKQLCEQPRSRSWDSYGNYRKFDTLEKDYRTVREHGDDEAFYGVSSGNRESMKRRYTLAGREKSFGEHLSPLMGIIRKNAGKYWDKVFSELCKSFDMRAATSNHILVHLYQFIEVKTFMHNGVVCYNDETRGKQALWGIGNKEVNEWDTARPITESQSEFYVHPISGCITHNVGGRNGWYERMKKERKIDDAAELATRYRKIDSVTELRKLDGTWYEVKYSTKPIGTNELGLPMRSYDLFGDTIVNDKLYADTKQSLSSKELKTYGVAND